MFDLVYATFVNENKGNICKSVVDVVAVSKNTENCFMFNFGKKQV